MPKLLKDRGQGEIQERKVAVRKLRPGSKAKEKGPARVLPGNPPDEAEKQRLRDEANKIRERMIMGACADMQDQLFEYSDKTIINAKTRRIRIKLTII